MLKRLPEDRLEEESLNAVSAFFNSNSWEFNRQVRDKSGIDGEVEIVHGIARTGRLLKCQVKAGSSYISSKTEEHLRIRVERKYLEHWSQMSAAVLLLFYHPTSRAIFWKAIKEHLDSYPNLLKQGTETCVIVFDKEQDSLTAESLAVMEQVERKRFSYSQILIEPRGTELGWSNWFPVASFPTLWEAPSTLNSRSHMAALIERDYSFVIHESRLITLSNIRDGGCELRRFVDIAGIRPGLEGDVPPTVFADLLNQALVIFGKRRDLTLRTGRFFFSSAALKSPDTRTFSYTSLKGKPETRQKIYVRRAGKITENVHHAVRLSFLRHLGEWFLLVEPDWYISYPFGTPPSRRDIGARITSEKASTYNKDYLYLLHFWRQYLSNNTGTIAITCSRPDDKATVDVSSLPLEFKFQFRLFNDYVGPKDKNA